MRKFIYAVKRVERTVNTSKEVMPYNFFDTPDEAVKHLKRCVSNLINFMKEKGHKVEVHIDQEHLVEFEEKSKGWMVYAVIDGVTTYVFTIIGRVLTDNANTIEYPIE